MGYLIRIRWSNWRTLPRVFLSAGRTLYMRGFFSYLLVHNQSAIAHSAMQSQSAIALFQTLDFLSFITSLKLLYPGHTDHDAIVTGL